MPSPSRHRAVIIDLALFTLVAVAVYYTVFSGCGRIHGQPVAVAKIVANDATPAQARINREAIEAALQGAGVCSLGAGTYHLDRSLVLTSLHSGSTLQGVGPQTVLKAAYVGGTPNCTVMLSGSGLAYANNATISSDGAAYVLSEVDLWQPDLLRPGNVVYAFVYDGYLFTPAPLPRKRYTIKSYDSATMVVTVDRRPDPKLTCLKWIDGDPVDDVREGVRAVRLVDASAASRFPPGRYVYITDGPSVANEATGEHRRVLSVDPSTGVVTIDAPLLRSYALPTLARVAPPAAITIRRLTIAQPAHAEGQPFYGKFAVDLKLDRVILDANPLSQAGFACSGRVTFTSCESPAPLTLNGVHDVLIDGGVYGGLLGEEACTVVTVRNATLRANPLAAPWPTNGINWTWGSDRLRVERVRIEGYGDWHPSGGPTTPLSIQGHGAIVRDVTITATEQSTGTAVYLNGDAGVVDRLTADVPVIVVAGKGWRVQDSAVRGWHLRAGTGGTMTGSVPVPGTATGWIIRPAK